MSVPNYYQLNYPYNINKNHLLGKYNDKTYINNSYLMGNYGGNNTTNQVSGISYDKICGIYNIGNNCYLNSGLQILASCTEFINELYKSNNIKGIVLFLKEAMHNLLNNRYYDPTKFIDYFSCLNTDFIKGTQCSSQDFIRTLIRNINSEYLKGIDNIISNNTQYNPKGIELIEYEKFIISNSIYPESKIQSLFSGITKSYSHEKCRYCDNNVEHISFNFFIDVNLYLDNINKKCDFSEVIKDNLGISGNLTMDCPHCHNEIVLKTETKFIKLPDILIFTIERFQGGPNHVEIIPETPIDMANYIDKNLSEKKTNYELFAINIRLGSSSNFGHEKCQVKRNGIWYEINDIKYDIISKPNSYYDSSYGLFYKKIK